MQANVFLRCLLVAVACLVLAYRFPVVIMGSALVAVMLLVKWAKIIRWRKSVGDAWSSAVLYGTATMLSKLPESRSRSACSRLSTLLVQTSGKMPRRCRA